MAQNQFSIDTKSLYENFERHLIIPGNNRILFSAPFGAGKSTYLNEFFNQTDDFIIIKLLPVNYSVASNEDIFELIKRDIVEQLLEFHGDKLDLSASDINPLVIFQSFAENKLDYFRLVKLFIKATIPGGETVGEIINEGETIFNEYKKYEEDIKRTDLDKFNSYVKSFEVKPGSIYERDSITQLITKFVLDIKASTDKQIILVIDDLDRLDPDHIFRLFNIFSAHYNESLESNKFSFDKVLFVCDVNNIHRIFANRFGQNVEFSGYIDKYYSKEVYEFDIKKLLQTKLQEFFKLKTSSIPEEIVDKYINPKKEFYTIFEYVITNLVDINAVKLRNLLKLHEYAPPAGLLVNIYRNQQHVSDFPFFFIYNIIRRLFPTIDELLIAIDQIARSYNSENISYGYYRNESLNYDYIHNKLISYCVPFILPPNVQRKMDEKSTVTDSFYFDDKLINYSVTVNDRRLDYDINETNLNPFVFLGKAIRSVRNRRIIN